jgi:hypothetical protein
VRARAGASAREDPITYHPVSVAAHGKRRSYNVASSVRAQVQEKILSRTSSIQCVCVCACVQVQEKIL